MKAICIDDTNKPKRIPQNEWIVEGETYTIIRFVRMELEKNKFGVLLKEVQLSSESFPYELYDAERFLPLDLLTNALYKEEESVLEADLELV
jgi:hypothetical protein|tara:strand:+ start:424 stop:699 length:276 start_codon:yes stop_codon:yes gene_type:complete